MTLDKVWDSDREVSMEQLGTTQPIPPLILTDLSPVILSVSTLQWLCNADKKEHSVPKRLFKFFSTLYACLVSIINFTSEMRVFVIGKRC